MAAIMSPNIQHDWLPGTPYDTFNSDYPTGDFIDLPGPSQTPYTGPGYMSISTPALSPELQMAQVYSQPMMPQSTPYQFHRQLHPGPPGFPVTPAAPYAYPGMESEYRPNYGVPMDYQGPSAPLFPGQSMDQPIAYRKIPNPNAPIDMRPPLHVSRAMNKLIQSDVKQRQRVTPENRDVLEWWYRRYDKPYGPLKKALVAQTKMEPRTIQVWYQNRRSKEKGLRRKARKQAKDEWIEKWGMQPPPHEDDTDGEEPDYDSEEPSTESDEYDEYGTKIKGKKKGRRKGRRQADTQRWESLVPVGPTENRGTHEVLINFPDPIGWPFPKKSYYIPPPDELRANGLLSDSAPKGRRASLANGEAVRIGHTPQNQAFAARRGSIPYPTPISTQSPVSPGIWNPEYTASPMRASPVVRPSMRHAAVHNHGIQRRSSMPAPSKLMSSTAFAPPRNNSASRRSTRDLSPIRDQDTDERPPKDITAPSFKPYQPFSTLTAAVDGPLSGPLPMKDFSFGMPMPASIPPPSETQKWTVPQVRDRLGSIASVMSVPSVTTETPTEEGSFDFTSWPAGYNFDARRASAPAGLDQGLSSLNVGAHRALKPSPLSNHAANPADVYDHERTVSNNMDAETMEKLRAISNIGSSPHVPTTSPLVPMGLNATPMSVALSHDSALPMQSFNAALQSYPGLHSSSPGFPSSVQSINASPINNFVPNLNHLSGFAVPSLEVSPETSHATYGAQFNMNPGDMFGDVFAQMSSSAPAQLLPPQTRENFYPTYTFPSMERHASNDSLGSHRSQPGDMPLLQSAMAPGGPGAEAEEEDLSWIQNLPSIPPTSPAGPVVSRTIDSS